MRGLEIGEISCKSNKPERVNPMNVNPMSVDKEKEFRRRIKAHQKSRVAAFFVLPPLFEQEDEKLNDKLNAEASSATQVNESQYNGLRHGGYSEELILPG